ncbi:MAG: DUF1778 domain-containing protein [Bryobacteraceae bacterium]
MSQTTSKTKSPHKSRSKAYRFDARLNEDQKTLIQRAADLEGRSMSDFVIQSAEIAAQRTIQDRSTLILTVREAEAFVELLLHPPEPGPVLLAAARHYKNTIGRK